MQIAIFGSYGQGNIGDEAIADGLAQVLKKAVPDCHLTLFSHQNPILADNHPHFVAVRPMIASGIRSFQKQKKSGVWAENIANLKNTDWVIIGGGGLFHDQEIGQKGFSPLFIWWLRCLLFKKLRKKVALASIGIGPIKKHLSFWWLKGILKCCDIITVRDELSQKIAQKLTKKPVTILPDPVWGLFSEPQPKTKSGVLGINIRLNHRFDHVELLQKLIQAVSKVQLVTVIKEIVLIPFALYQPDDRELMNALLPVIAKHTQLPVSIQVPHSTNEAYILVSACDHFIATRFHSYIFASCANVPCELLSYSDKTDQINKQSKQYYLEHQKLAVAFWHERLQVDGKGK